jgi:hypothetical protein
MALQSDVIAFSQRYSQFSFAVSVVNTALLVLILLFK